MVSACINTSGVGCQDMSRSVHSKRHTKSISQVEMDPSWGAPYAAPKASVVLNVQMTVMQSAYST